MTDDDLGPDEVEDDPVSDAPERAEPAPFTWRSLAGAAALVLALHGVLLATLGSFPLLDPAGARCTLARAEVEDANADDDDSNDVAVDGDVDDLSCAEAEAAAESIPVDDGEDTLTLPGETSFRVQGAVYVAIALTQVAGGLLVLRTGRRWARNVALVGAVLGLLAPIGLLTLLIVGFVVFGLFFSQQARLVWPRPVRAPREA